MTARRDTYTAILFLAGLLCAAVFLITGALPRSAVLSVSPRESRPRLQTISKLSPTQTEEPEAALLPRPARQVPHSMKVHIVQPLAVTLEQTAEKIDSLTESAGPALGELLDRDHAFIELYGEVQRLMGRRIMDDAEPQYTVAKLSNGSLAFADPEDRQTDMSILARDMVRFARRVWRRSQVPVLYVQAPSKLDVAALPQGMTNYADAEADQFLAELGPWVDTLDLRPVFRAVAEDDPEGAAELFFRTDHHWTPAGAFLAFQVLCETLEENYGMEIDPSLTDPDSYDRIELNDYFLGSQGRRVGSRYAGLDDFQIWTPTFSTHFNYSVPLSGIDREGSFTDTLLFLDRLERHDLYEDNPYLLYSGGDYLLTRAVNRNAGDAPRIVVLRDSFGCALTPFLSLTAGEVKAVDPRGFNGGQEDMLEYLRWLDPDLVIVLNTTSSLRAPALFPYLPSAKAALEEPAH